MSKRYKVLKVEGCDGITRRSDNKIFFPGEEAELELTPEEEKTLLDMKAIEPIGKVKEVAGDG